MLVELSMTTNVGKPSATGQAIRRTQPFTIQVVLKKIMKIRNNILNKAMVYCMLRPQHLLHDGLV